MVIGRLAAKQGSVEIGRETLSTGFKPNHSSKQAFDRFTIVDGLSIFVCLALMVMMRILIRQSSPW